jgi:hypothetical protein
MNRKEAFLKIKAASQAGGFTLLDVLPEFKGVAPSVVQGYLKTAFVLGFVELHPTNPLCLYRTEKLMKLN